MAYSEQLHELVVDEVKVEFNQNTSLHLDAGGTASAFIHIALHQNVFPLLDSGKIEWGGRARRFVLDSAAGLARAAQACAKEANKTVIDEQVLRTAIKGDGKSSNLAIKAGLLPFWERTCPLPTPGSKTEQLRAACVGLHELLAKSPAKAT